MRGRTFIQLVYAALQVTIALSKESEELMRNVTMLCPYTDFCEVKASKTFEDSNSIPCCMPCSCEDDCWKKRDCCPDKANRSTGAAEVVCNSPVVKYTEEDIMVKKYLIVNRCPVHEGNESLKHKCSKPETSLEEFVWVSDSATGKIFQNKYCALCNGVTDWENWDIVTNCIEIMNVTRFDDLANVLLSDDCTIENTAEGLTSISNIDICYTPDISVCNQTGLWNYYDRGLDEACQRHTVPFLQYERRGLQVYKNAFCYLCNTPHAHASDTICYGGDKPFKTTMHQLGILINFQELENLEVPNYVCAAYEIHDKYTNKCRKLLCPFGSASAYGECRSKSVNNLGFIVVLNLSIVWEETTFLHGQRIDFTEKNGKDIFVAVTKLIGLRKKCKFCSGEVTVAMNGTEIRRPVTGLLLWLRYTTSADCGLNVMSQHIERSIGQTVGITINKERMALSINFETRPYSDIWDFKMLYISYVSLFCFDSFHRQIKKRCPEIELVLSEVMTETSKKVRDGLLLLFEKSGLDKATTVQVCVEDYFELMTKSVNVATRMETVYSLLVLLTVMLLCG